MSRNRFLLGLAAHVEEPGEIRRRAARRALRGTMDMSSRVLDEVVAGPTSSGVKFGAEAIEYFEGGGNLVGGGAVVLEAAGKAAGFGGGEGLGQGHGPEFASVVVTIADCVMEVFEGLVAAAGGGREVVLGGGYVAVE